MFVQRGLLLLHGTALLCVTLPFLVLLNLLPIPRNVRAVIL